MNRRRWLKRWVGIMIASYAIMMTTFVIFLNAMLPGLSIWQDKTMLVLGVGTVVVSTFIISTWQEWVLSRRERSWVRLKTQ